jgi:hypothetical protein
VRYQNGGNHDKKDMIFAPVVFEALIAMLRQ